MASLPFFCRFYRFLCRSLRHLHGLVVFADHVFEGFDAAGRFPCQFADQSQRPQRADVLDHLVDRLGQDLQASAAEAQTSRTPVA